MLILSKGRQMVEWELPLLNTVRVLHYLDESECWDLISELLENDLCDYAAASDDSPYCRNVRSLIPYAILKDVG